MITATSLTITNLDGLSLIKKPYLNKKRVTSKFLLITLKGYQLFKSTNRSSYFLA